MSGWAAPLPRRSGAAMAGRAPPSNLIMTSLCCAASSRGIPADAAANQKALFILSPQLKPKLNRGGVAVIGGGQGRERTRVIDGALGGVVRGLVPTALGDVHVAHRSVPHEFEGDDGGRKGMDTRIHVSGVPFLGNALPQDRHIVSEPVAERRSLPDAHAVSNTSSPSTASRWTSFPPRGSKRDSGWALRGAALRNRVRAPCTATWRRPHAQTSQLRKRHSHARARVRDERWSAGGEPLPDQLDQADQPEGAQEAHGQTGEERPRWGERGDWSHWPDRSGRKSWDSRSKRRTGSVRHIRSRTQRAHFCDSSRRHADTHTVESPGWCIRNLRKGKYSP